MIIIGTKKKKPKKIDNITKMIDTAGETQFKNIYKNLQAEIKDKIITKLLLKLEKQNKQLEQYKEEIISLKNDLVYLLKRIILSNNEQKLNPNLQIRKGKNKIIKKNSSSNCNIQTFYGNSNSIFVHLNKMSTQKKPFFNRKNKVYNNNIVNNKIIIDISNINNNNNYAQTVLDLKINNYLNSIYKHNFLKNETNINNYYSLNKKETLFEEIFHKKNNYKIVEYYIGTNPCMNKINFFNSNRSLRNISSSLNKMSTDYHHHDRNKSKNHSTSIIKIKNKNEYIIDSNNNDKFDDFINNNKSDDNKYI